MEEMEYINNVAEEEHNLIPFSEQVLQVQKMLNQIHINDKPLEENGYYNDETKNAIIKLQQITQFEPNGVIDQNLIFRLNEIIENPIINEYNKNRTFAVLYWNYINQNRS